MSRDRRLGSSIAIDRLTAGFEYVGPPMDRVEAKALWLGEPPIRHGDDLLAQELRQKPSTFTGGGPLGRSLPAERAEVGGSPTGRHADG